MNIYINYVTFKVQIVLGIDCRPKFNLHFKAMLKRKFPNKHVSGILCGALFWPPTETGLCVHLDETNGNCQHTKLNDF